MLVYLRGMVSMPSEITLAHVKHIVTAPKNHSVSWLFYCCHYNMKFESNTFQIGTEATKIENGNDGVTNRHQIGVNDLHSQTERRCAGHTGC